MINPHGIENPFSRLSNADQKELEVYTPEYLAYSVIIALLKRLKDKLPTGSGELIAIPVTTLESDAQEVGAHNLSAFTQFIELMAVETESSGRTVRLSLRDSVVEFWRGAFEAKFVFMGLHDQLFSFNFWFVIDDSPIDPEPEGGVACELEWQLARAVDTPEKMAHYDKLKSFKTLFSEETTEVEKAYMFAILAEGLRRSVV